MCWYPTTLKQFIHDALGTGMKVTDHGNGVHEATETGNYRTGASVFYVQGKGVSDYVKPGTPQHASLLTAYSTFAAQEVTTPMTGEEEEEDEEPILA